MVILAAILIFSGGMTYVLLRNYLGHEIDNNLKNYSSRVHGSLTGSGPLDFTMIHTQLPPINEFASPGIYIQVLDQTGKVVSKSVNLGQQELPINPALLEDVLRGKAAIATLAGGEGSEVRVQVSPMYMQDQTMLLEVGQSLQHKDSTMNQVLWSLTGGILGALILAGASGVFLVRRALSPVDDITKTARKIADDPDLHRRVGHKGPNDEIGRLATTFDQMIDRLDKTFQMQKHFVADSSHELRTPLTVIRGNIDLLKRDLDEGARKETLQALESETQRMNRIVNDLLTLAEIEAGQVKFDDVAIKDLVMDGVERAGPLAGTRRVIPGKVEDIILKGDGYRLTQLLDNLTGNALKYTPEGTTITVSLIREGEFARLDISDSGPGIAPEHLPHLFDRFYRVDKARSRASGGTGLGLALVKGIAELHGGRVAVSSQVGLGSTFTVWLKV